MMKHFNAYWRLARLHKPIGTLLLWYPTAWALWIANQGNPPLKLLIIFLLGTLVMRSAGCILNDIADRHIDLYVKRTALRPLTTGEVSLLEAWGLFIFFLGIALGLLMQLPARCFIYALLSVFVTVIYPFCKRLIQAPQLVLGIAFSMGIPMAYVASGTRFDGAFCLLFVINFIWIMAYDTQYAMVDRDDDLLIGIQSTAIYFGDWDRIIVNSLLLIMHLLWLVLGWMLGLSTWFLMSWIVACGILMKQYRLIQGRQRAEVMHAFLLNNWYGFIIWCGLVDWQVSIL